MKNFKIMLSLVAVAAALTACNDLDKEYLGGYVSDEQKKETIKLNPERAQAGVTGIMASASTYCSVYSNHFDFGIPACFIFMDQRGIDYPTPPSGYNHFSAPIAMSDCNSTSSTTNMWWSHFYKQAFACNAVCKGIEEDTDDPELQFYLAQAKAIRAYDYFMLIQLYQFTYSAQTEEGAGKDLPGIPVITDKNEQEATVNGMPRGTVEGVYEAIMTDLNDAVRLMEASKVRPSQVLAAKPKRFLDLGGIYGLRARVELVKNDWAAAAADARLAINNFNGAAAPANMVNPGEGGNYPFWSLDENNWMWGIAINETDRVVTSGIVNFPSMMSLLVGNSYVGVGAWRPIGTALYEQIPSTDVRKNWWLANDGTEYGYSPNPDIDAYNKDEMGAPAYMNVKFGPYQNKLGNTTKACDIPLMRVEEMYLIEAEATAMAGNAGGGAQLLTNFVQAYRDPAYTCKASTPEAVQEAVWIQRRVELWGEGISTLDLNRLKKDFDRRNNGYDATYIFNVPAFSNVLRMPIPDGEITGNKAITTQDNNPDSKAPKPVPNN